jgi:hypothetical protein
VSDAADSSKLTKSGKKEKTKVPKNFSRALVPEFGEHRIHTAMDTVSLPLQETDSSITAAHR